ncbi:acyltransferase [Sphingomonas sp. KR1UV-12]|uniref:Acyltransferase n=1 Tax=Sphingomonas aurea TaxID=3063994 RepID=A0ABT9EMF6_9SPHN|nr:acyltransferase [Sphingomonas sp. KR1UV-12]MDP1028040.1 acyltransferase [Sphingomonas sp. KR1UV-12]
MAEPRQELHASVATDFGEGGAARRIIGRRRTADAPLLMTNILNGDNNVTVARLMLALMVLWSHSFAIYLGDEGIEPIAQLTRGLYNAGNVGVACFLILSGALILRSWESSSSAWRFTVKRAQRLYPAYLVAVFAGAYIVAPIYAGLDPWGLLRQSFPTWLGANLVFRGYAPVDQVFEGAPIAAINGSLWSIWYEVFCYIGLVAGVSLLRQRFVVGCWVVLAILTAAKIYADLTGWNPGFGIIGAVVGWPLLWFSVAGWFVTGMLFHAYRTAIPRSPLILLGIAVAWLAATWLPSQQLTARILMDVIYTPGLAYILFYVCSTPKTSVEMRARANDLSYGMYLYAFPTQQIIRAELGPGQPFLVYFALSATCTLVLSIVSWKLVERPFMAGGYAKAAQRARDAQAKLHQR